MNLENYTQMVIELAIKFAPSVLLAIVTLIIGFWVIGRIVGATSRLMEMRKMDISLRPFLLSLLGVSLKVMLLLSVASIVGIQTTSFVAVVGAASLAIGLALQGSLSNFAGGVIILVFKPFKVGDHIVTQGMEGDVVAIQIFHTILRTPDLRDIIVPNGPLITNTIVNFSAFDSLRPVNINIPISPANEYAKVKEILLEVGKSHPKNAKPNDTFVGISAIKDQTMFIDFIVWCKPSDYVSVNYGLTENVKLAFEKGGIIPAVPAIYVRQ
jgi:small conductance mechanosensitive channel